MKLAFDDVSLMLGSRIDPDTLKAAPFQKVGVMKRILTRSPKGRDLYTAENAKLACLDSGFSIFPCTHRYLDEDRRWQTRASLYVSDGRLEEVLYEVIDGRYAAGNFLDRFSEVCTQVLGEPVSGEGGRTVWRNGHALVSGFLHDNGVDAEFRFEWTGDGSATTSSRESS